ncbi:sugar phosphate isomerase/epimerase family protein [Dactylosporangium sp. McL0621]|uniref:sugar phosphate isomerase/epimerase family protein n=1 Tax=Dactylosporangium sp. McL0621 TaxID=3415678 RepID=UPI003CEBCEC9
MRFGYGTNGFSNHRLDDALAVIAGLGYEGVALTLDHHHLDPFDANLSRHVREVGRRLQELGLGVVIETGARYLLDPWRKHAPTLLDDEPGPRLEFLRRAVRIGADLGAEAVSFWAGVPPRKEAGVRPGAEVGGSPGAKVGGSPGAKVGGSPGAEAGGSPHAELGGSPHAAAGGSQREKVGVTLREKDGRSQREDVRRPPRAEVGRSQRAEVERSQRAEAGATPRGLERDEAWRRLVTGCAEVLAAAEGVEMMLGFEPEPGMLVETIDDWERLRADLGAPVHFGLTLDIGHCRCLEPVPADECVRKAAGSLVNVQIDDMRRGVHEHLEFGQGEVDFPPVLRALSDIGYGGLVCVELPRHSHAAPAVARASLEFLKAVAA